MEIDTFVYTNYFMSWDRMLGVLTRLQGGQSWFNSQQVQNKQCKNLTTHLHLELRLIMCDTIPPLLCMSSLHGELIKHKGNFNFTFLVT